MTGWLAIAGLGPGDEALVTPEASAALAEATDVIGYIPYVARVAQRPGLTLHASDNRVENERAELALTLAAAGKKVVVVSSGDPGSGCQLYAQRTCGGSDMRIDSVRPPDCRPNKVPRS